MNTEDRFDDLIKKRLRDSAPDEAPARVLEETMARVSETSQGGRRRLGGNAERLLAAAAVLLIAIVAGTQLAGIINRPVGTSQTPPPSATETPAPTAAAPSATVAPLPSPSDTEANGLLLRIVAGGGPTSPLDDIPWVSIMDDGSIVWSPAPTGPEVETLLVRQLTPNGLADLTAIIFDSGLLSEDATYELERRPEAPEPPGRGVVVYQFTSGIGDDLATITSVQWLGDEEEETYYQPSPERRALDELARALRDPESLVDAGAWRGPAEPYVAADYQLVLMPQPDNAQYGNPDVADLPLDYDGPIEEFGVDATSPGGPVTRCGVVTQEEAAGIVAVFEAGDFGDVGLDQGTAGGLDWAEGNGTVDVVLLPRMQDGHPACVNEGP
jgi:hypothetical protein